MLSGPLDERLSSKIDLKTWHFTLVLAWVKFKCHVNSWNPTIWLYLVMWTSINLACCLAGHLVRLCVWCSKRYFTKRLVSLRPPQDEWGRRGPRRPEDAWSPLWAFFLVIFLLTGDIRYIFWSILFCHQQKAYMRYEKTICQFLKMKMVLVHNFQA